jgi:hypothetical protein
MKQIKIVTAVFPFQRLMNYAILILLVTSQSSCFKKYYQTNTTHKVDSAALGQLQLEQKNFVIQTPDTSFALNNVRVSGDSLTGEMALLNPKNHRLLNPQQETQNEMSRADKVLCVSEVHLYTDSSFIRSGQAAIAINRITRMDVYSLDKKAIRASRVTGVVVITASVALGVVVIAAMASSMSDMSFHMTFPN